MHTSLPTTSTNLDITNSGSSTKPGLTFKRVDDPIENGTNIGTIQFAGAIAADTDTPNIGASISGQAAQTWVDGGAAGANIRFSTSINNSGALHEKMRITEDGTVGIFYNTTGAFNPVAPNILQIRVETGDGSILMETQSNGNQAALKLANIPASSGTSSVAEVGYIQFEASDGGNVENICQVKGELTSNTTGFFSGALKFSTIEDGTENNRMRIIGTNSEAEPMLSLNVELLGLNVWNTGFFLPSADAIGFTTGGTERARLSPGGGSQLALATGGSASNCTVCALGTNGNHCGLAFPSTTQLQMSVDNGSGTASLRMQMNNNPSAPAINFHVDNGASLVPALHVTSTIAASTANDTHGIKVPFTTAPVLGGIARASLNDISNWQDGHMGNCERLYFTATDFKMAGGPPGFIGALYDVTPGEPTYAYGEYNWIATKLLPVGFKIDNDADIVVMGYWPTSPMCVVSQISSLELYATNITQDGQITTTICAPTVPANTNTLSPLLPVNPKLNTAYQTTSASLTSGIGKAFGSQGGPTIMITIKVTLVPSVTFPGSGGGPNEGITGALIDMIRQ